MKRIIQIALLLLLISVSAIGQEKDVYLKLLNYIEEDSLFLNKYLQDTKYSNKDTNEYTKFCFKTSEKLITFSVLFFENDIIKTEYVNYPDSSKIIIKELLSNYYKYPYGKMADFRLDLKDNFECPKNVPKYMLFFSIPDNNRIIAQIFNYVDNNNQSYMFYNEYPFLGYTLYLFYFDEDKNIKNVFFKQIAR